MIDRLIVHIGQHKTGTTALQQTLHQNAERLRGAGLCYPVRAGDARTDHRAIGFELGVGMRAFAPGPAWEEFQATARSSGLDTAILSSETLIALTPERIGEVAKLFGTLAKSVDILVYVRHPVHFANSAVSTQLRLGRTLEQFMARPTLDRVRPAIRHWRDALEAEGLAGSVIVRSYERDVDPQWNIVDDALVAIGHGALAGTVERSRFTANISFSTLGVYVMDWINRQPREEPLPHGSVSAFSQIEGPAYVLPDASRAAIRDQTAHLHTFLARHHGVILHEREEPESPPCPLDEAELSSLATMLLATTQFGFEVQRSRIGRWFGLSTPFFTRPPAHPVLKGLRAAGLLLPLIGPHGQRARTLHRTLPPSSADTQDIPPGGADAALSRRV